MCFRAFFTPFLVFFFFYPIEDVLVPRFGVIVVPSFDSRFRNVVVPSFHTWFGGTFWTFGLGLHLEIFIVFSIENMLAASGSIGSFGTLAVIRNLEVLAVIRNPEVFAVTAIRSETFCFVVAVTFVVWGIQDSFHSWSRGSFVALLGGLGFEIIIVSRTCIIVKKIHS